MGESGLSGSFEGEGVVGRSGEKKEGVLGEHEKKQGSLPMVFGLAWDSLLCV